MTSIFHANGELPDARNEFTHFYRILRARRDSSGFFCVGCTAILSRPTDESLRPDFPRVEPATMILSFRHFVRSLGVLPTRSRCRESPMRRISLFAAVLAVASIAQSAFAGSHFRDDCSSGKCHSFSAAASRLGFSYFCSGHHGCGGGYGHGCGYGYGHGYGHAWFGGDASLRCPTYVYPNRSPRDFWMLP